MANLSQIIDFTFAREGGFVDNADDRGGATNLGVTLKTFIAWRLSQGQTTPTVADLKALTKEEATLIYNALYFKAVSGQQIADSVVALSIFDGAVLNGVATAAKAAQIVASANGSPLVIDGRLGPTSLAAINSMQRKPFVLGICSRYDNMHLADVLANPNQKQFLNGWLKRTALIRGQIHADA